MVLGSHVTNGFDQLAVNLIKLRAQLAAAVKYQGRIRGGVLGVHGPPPLGLHRYIEQYVYYPAVLYCTIDNFIYKCGDSAY